MLLKGWRILLGNLDKYCLIFNVKLSSLVRLFFAKKKLFLRTALSGIVFFHFLYMELLMAQKNNVHRGQIFGLVMIWILFFGMLVWAYWPWSFFVLVIGVIIWMLWSKKTQVPD